MTEKEWKRINYIMKEIERLRQEKRSNIVAIQNYYRTDGGAIMSFPSVCKQPMSNIICAYYDREIAMVQAQLDAIEIKFGNSDDNSQSD